MVGPPYKSLKILTSKLDSTKMEWKSMSESFATRKKNPEGP